MAVSARVDIDERSEPRDEVHHRTRASRQDGAPIELVIVNISARGLMARCDASFETGDRLRLKLPAIGTVAAEIRWSLGGRIGCQLDETIPLASYFQLLAAMAKST